MKGKVGLVADLKNQRKENGKMTEKDKAILKELANFEIVKECMTSEEERFPDYCVFL